MSHFTKYLERLFLKKKKEEIELVEEKKTDKEKVLGWRYSKSDYFYYINSPDKIKTEPINEENDSMIHDSSQEESEIEEYQESTFDEVE